MPVIPAKAVIPAHAGSHFTIVNMDSRMRGNDGYSRDDGKVADQKRNQHD